MASYSLLQEYWPGLQMGEAKEKLLNSRSKNYLEGTEMGDNLSIFYYITIGGACQQQRSYTHDTFKIR